MDYAATDYLRTLIFPLLLSLPIFLVVLGGIAYSIFRYKTSPKISIFTIIALLLVGVSRILAVSQSFMSLWVVNSSISIETFGYLTATLSIVATMFGAIALGLLVFAVWSRRVPNSK